MRVPGVAAAAAVSIDAYVSPVPTRSVLDGVAVNGVGPSHVGTTGGVSISTGASTTAFDDPPHATSRIASARIT